MRTKLACAVAIVIASFLLVTNPVVAEAAKQITGKQIKDDSLTGKDVKDGSLLSGDFAAGQLPAGPRGAQGIQGIQGTAGPMGPITTQNTGMTAIPLDTLGIYTFVGAPVTLTLTTPASLISSATASFHTASGTAVLVIDVCFQVGTDPLQTASNGGFQRVTVTTNRTVFPVSGASSPLAAGTYKVGYCAGDSTVAIPTDGDNNWVAGWFQAVPSASVSKSDAMRPARRQLG